MASKKEIFGLRQDELDSRLSEVKTELMKQNAQIATGTVPKSPGQIRQLKKTIARILTALNQRKQGGQKKE